MSDKVKRFAGDISGVVWLSKHESLLFALLKAGKVSVVDDRFNPVHESLTGLVDAPKGLISVFLHGQISENEFSILPPLNEESRKAVHVFIMKPDFCAKHAPKPEMEDIKTSHRMWIEGDGKNVIMIFLPRTLDTEWKPLQQSGFADMPRFISTPERPTPNQLKGTLMENGLYVIEATLRASKNACAALRVLNNHSVTKYLNLDLRSGRVFSSSGVPFNLGFWHLRQYADYLCASIEQDGDIVRVAFFMHFNVGTVLVDISSIPSVPLQTEDYVQEGEFETIALKLGKTGFN